MKSSRFGACSAKGLMGMVERNLKTGFGRLVTWGCNLSGSLRWHWAFYSYRSGDWDGMDYELGVEKLGWKYWEAREQGKGHEKLIRRRDNPLLGVFKKEFVEKQGSVER